jgi:drug/metabolite transporter (DMT)-like permease
MVACLASDHEPSSPNCLEPSLGWVRTSLSIVLIHINMMTVVIHIRLHYLIVSHATTVGLFVLLAVLWGSSFAAVRAALPYVPPLPLAALRFDIAGVLMLGYAIATTDRWRPRSRQAWLGIGLGGLLFIATHHSLLFIGQQYVTSAVAAVVISLDPVLAAAFSRILLPDERLSLLGGLGLGCGIVGVGVIAQPDSRQLVTADVLGVALVFGAAAAFALGAVLTCRFWTELPVQTMQAWMMLTGAPLLHVASYLAPSVSFIGAQ